MATPKKSTLLHVMRQLQVTMTVREWNADTADHVGLLLRSAGFDTIELPADHQIAIEWDQDYEPDGDYDLEEERRKLISGEYGAYRVFLQRECECGNWITVQSLHGVVVEGSNHDGSYGTIEGIGDGYLREVACDLMIEEGLA